MKYHLDANAWIRLFKDATAYASVLDAFQGKSLEVVLTQQIVAELTDSERIRDSSTIESNLEFLNPFLKTLESDSIFVLGYSKLDGARLSTERGAELFSTHLLPKLNKLRHVRDGIHLVNASETLSTLVSCDRSVLSTSKRVGSVSICLEAFLQPYRQHGRKYCDLCKK